MKRLIIFAEEILKLQINMNKDAYYFPHDSNSKDDPKCVLLIERLGMEGYGIFWMLLEVLREQSGYRCPLSLLPALARRYKTKLAKIEVVINDFGLFRTDEENFYSLSFLRRMYIIDEKREKRKLAGQKGGLAKSLNYNEKQCVTSRSVAMLNQCQDNVNSITKQCCSKSQARKINKKRGNNTEKNISLLSSPLQEVEKKELKEDESIFDFIVYPDIEAKIKELLEGLPNIISRDYSEALRFCSGKDKALCLSVLERLILWRKSYNGSENFYDELRRLKKLEVNGEIHPPSIDVWRLFEFLKITVLPDELKGICSLVRSEHDRILLENCISVIRAGKISFPAKYIISTLNQK